MIKMLGASELAHGQQPLQPKARDLLLALYHVLLVLPYSNDSAPGELAAVNYVIGLRGDHALDVVLHVAQHDAIPLALLPVGLGLERFDLEALEDGGGKPRRDRVRVAENSPGCVLATDIRGTRRSRSAWRNGRDMAEE